MSILPYDEEILSPSDDYIFKAIMTREEAKPALIDLISAVIGLKILDVKIRNNELPVTGADEKNERLDINCVIDDDSQVDVEMQGSRLEGSDNGRISLINKAIYYLTDLHSSQKSKGVKYADLVRSYQITFCAHNIFKWQDYMTEASIRTRTGIQISDQINLFIIELSKLGDVLQKPINEMTPLEMWSTFLGYADDPLKRTMVNKILDEREEICMAGTILTEISKDEHERAKAMSRRKFQTDIQNDLLVAEERGEKRGEDKANKKWQAVVSKKETEIAELRAQLEKATAQQNSEDI